jgi:hypothetical protein
MQVQEDIKSDTYEPSVDEMLDSSFGMILPEIKFPKNKKELIQFVKDFQNEFRIKYHKVPLVTEQALTVMENLPDLNIIYKNLKQLSDHLERAVYDEKVQKKLLNKGIRIRDVAIGVLDTERRKNAVMKKMVESDDDFRRRFKEQQLQVEKSTTIK